MQSMLLLLPLLLLQFQPCLSSSSSYRHYYVDNADVCPGPEADNPAKGNIKVSQVLMFQCLVLVTNVFFKVLDIGEGAAILTLKSPSQRLQPEYRNKAVQCAIHIKVSEVINIFDFLPKVFGIFQPTLNVSP